MDDISLHILDVAENGISAGANLITILMDEDTNRDEFRITIKDNGRGMTQEFVARVLDPFVTTRTTRKVGLGLSLFQQSAQEAEGDLVVESELGKGTKIHVDMRLNHIDRKPLGDMAETMVTLIEGNPCIDFVYCHCRDGRTFELDTREIRLELEEVPINSPDVIQFLRENVREGLEELRAGEQSF